MLKEKWKKGGGSGDNGERCLLLTLTDKCERMDAAWYHEADLMAKIIERWYGAEEISTTQVIIKFNDAPETTFEDVKRVWDELFRIDAKAREIVGLLQGTMALEGAGLDETTLAEMLVKTREEVFNAPAA